MTTERYLRISDICGEPAVSEEQAARNRERGRGPRKASPGKVGILPMGQNTWWRWVQEGKAPKPVKLSTRMTCWRESDVAAFQKRMEREHG